MTKLHAWIGGTLAIDLSTATPETQSIINAIRSDLMLYRREFAGEKTPAAFFEEENGWLHIPRGFILTEMGHLSLTPWADFFEHRSHGRPLPPGTSVRVEFGVSRPGLVVPKEQPEFIASIVRGAMANRHGGLCLAPTRAGKTLCAIEAACRLGGAVLILVDRAPLLRQWVEEIEKHVRDGAGNPMPVGVIREDRFESVGAPFVVATMQTLARRALDEEFRRGFRTVILDEAQTAPCELAWSALRRVESYYVLGLTATPDRKDGLTRAIKWVIGPVIATLERQLEADVHFIRAPWNAVKIPRENKDEDGEPTGDTRLVAPRVQWYGQVNRRQVEMSLFLDREYVDLVADELVRARKSGRRVLAFVEYLDSVAALGQAFRLRNETFGAFVGGLSDADQIAAMVPDITIATLGAGNKGINFQPPYTLAAFCNGTISDPRQAQGRALNPQAPFRSMVADFVPQQDRLIEQARRRLAHYRACGFTIRNSP